MESGSISIDRGPLCRPPFILEPGWGCTTSARDHYRSRRPGFVASRRVRCDEFAPEGIKTAAYAPS